MKVSTLIILLCHQIFIHSVVDAKLKVSILNVYINKTSSKFVNVVKFDVSSDSVVNIETDLLQDLTSAYVSIEAFSNKNGIVKSIVKTPSYDLCGFLKNLQRKESTIVHLITKQMIKSVKLPVTSCPIPKGRISLRNFRFDGSKIPTMVPSGFYYVFYNVLTIDKGVKIVILREGFDVKVERL